MGDSAWHQSRFATLDKAGHQAATVQHVARWYGLAATAGLDGRLPRRAPPVSPWLRNGSKSPRVASGSPLQTRGLDAHPVAWQRGQTAMQGLDVARSCILKATLLYSVD